MSRKRAVTHLRLLPNPIPIEEVSELTDSKNSTNLPSSKVCSVCQIEKPASDFYINDQGSVPRLYSRCRQCCAIVRNARYAENLEANRAYQKAYREKHVEKFNRRVSEWRRSDPARTIIARAKHRAKKIGIEFSITVNDILPLPTHCPVLGIPLKMGTRSKGSAYIEAGCYSLDRIDSSKGYVPGNVVIMSFRANSIKNDATPEEIHALSRWIASVTEEQRKLRLVS